MKRNASKYHGDRQKEGKTGSQRKYSPCLPQPRTADTTLFTLKLIQTVLSSSGGDYQLVRLEPSLLIVH